MSKKSKNLPNSELSFCLKHGISIYVVSGNTLSNIKDDKGSRVYQDGFWYVQINNNGILTTYKKPLNEKKTNSFRQSGKEIEITINHWANKIKSKLK